MGRECAVNIVELLLAGGVHRQRQPQVFAGRTLARDDGQVVKARVMFAHQRAHDAEQFVGFEAHDFDGKIAGELDQRRFGIRKGVHIL